MSMPKRIPVRRCMGCNQPMPKPQLIRVVRSPQGEILLDLHGKAAGRGAYLCKDPDCLAKARKSRRIDRSLEVEIPQEIYDRMEQQLQADAD